MHSASRSRASLPFTEAIHLDEGAGTNSVSVTRSNVNSHDHPNMVASIYLGATLVNALN